MSDYKFTQDWFSWAPPVWEQLIPMLSGTPGNRQFLEIGSFEGRSAVWIAENMMQTKDILVCIDTWEGGEEHTNGEMGGAEARFDHNRDLILTRRAVEIDKCKKPSIDALADIIKTCKKPLFDFIYIDGSHIAKDVLTDACMAWPLLKPKGIMVFDDYMWGEPRDILHRPKPAIDAFVNLFAEEVDMVHMGYQLIVRKK